MGIRYNKPPIRYNKKSSPSAPDLVKENTNLRRLLNMVKSYVIHDDTLYNEINEALNK
jgi:hypothetical protein